MFLSFDIILTCVAVLRLMTLSHPRQEIECACNSRKKDDLPMLRGQVVSSLGYNKIPMLQFHGYDANGDSSTNQVV
jgi:hypothetical protein